MAPFIISALAMAGTMPLLVKEWKLNLAFDKAGL
jgi:hypothetical protein